MNIDLDAIQARADAATEGPWKTARHDLSLYVQSRYANLQANLGYVGNHPEADADFIAAARTDVPALLALVREQAAKLDELLALAHVADVNDQQFGDGNGGSLTTEAIRAALEARA